MIYERQIHPMHTQELTRQPQPTVNRCLQPEWCDWWTWKIYTRTHTHKLTSPQLRYSRKQTPNTRKHVMRANCKKKCSVAWLIWLLRFNLMCVCQNLCLHFFPNSVGLRVCGSGVGSRMVLIVPTIYGLWVGIFYTNWDATWAEHEMGRHFLCHLGGHLGRKWNGKVNECIFKLKTRSQ